MRQRVRVFLLAAIAALFVISVPWYRTGGEAPALWWGLPDRQGWAFDEIIPSHIAAGLKRLFMSHPPLDERIAALRNMD